MKLLIVLLSCLFIVFQIREQLFIKKLKKNGIQAIESFHIQWLAFSLLWFVASAFLGLSYHKNLLSANINSNQLYLSLFYLLMACIYVLKSFNKDIISKDYLWTSKGKILWVDVRTYRFINDDTGDYIYLEVESKGKTTILKFKKSDQIRLERLIESIYRKYKF